ncbi:NUDIX domain-containing protein [Holdemania filiformis]|uniref:NUDIX domain-containing protein n=1 Tax=Holdemania filiformis TaxID=61171 RepID=UPI000A025818
MSSRRGNLDGEWQEELLLTQRHPDKLYGLVWEMNGGPVLAGEINRKGACRELREEAGLRCARLCEKRFYQ